MRPRLLAACLGVAAAVCLVVAYLNRNLDREGAYFDSDKGWTRYPPLDEGTGGNLAAPLLAEETGSAFDPFDWSSGYLWLGAGIALALVAVAVLVLGRSANRFAGPS